MTIRYVHLILALAVVGTWACGGAESVLESNEEGGVVVPLIQRTRQPFVGAWALKTIERRNVEGELLEPPAEDQVGYLMYDETGYRCVTLMRPNRPPPARVVDGRGEPTAQEALQDYSAYISYFGRFTVNEEERMVTHHLEGSLNPGGVGSDYERSYNFLGGDLVLKPPMRDDGSQSLLTWERLPDLDEGDLSETHRKLFGVFRVESVTRHTTDGYEVEAEQYDTAYLLYARSGHMSVHLMRPGRRPFAADQPTADEALHAKQSYGSYFGPFSVHEIAGCISCPGPRDQGYLLHHRVGSEDPSANGVDARRYYELSDTHLTLRPPVRTDEQGRQVISVIRWTRLGPS